MTTLIAQIEALFIVTHSDPSHLTFVDGYDEFILTDGNLYASCDGQLLPGCKKVSRIAQVVKFVNDRK